MDCHACLQCHHVTIIVVHVWLIKTFCREQKTTSLASREWLWITN